MPDQTPNAPTGDGVVLRPMTPADLPFAQALTDLLRWPHRLADWAQVFAHAEGIVAERDGEIIGCALRWLWGERHATLGLVVVLVVAAVAQLLHQFRRRVSQIQRHGQIAVFSRVFERRAVGFIRASILRAIRQIGDAVRQIYSGFNPGTPICRPYSVSNSSGVA